MLNIERNRILRIVFIAIAMTTFAEVIYLIVWGIVLFPGGSVLGKVMWTATCGLAMGSVIAVGVLVAAEGLVSGPRAFWRAAAIMALVGVTCAVICGLIDRNFNYFGAKDSFAQFFLSGGIPALAGGIVYGWLLYLPGGQKLLR